MKIKLLTLFSIFSLAVNGQNCYWQQRAEYRMTIDFNEKDHRFKGQQSLTYYNNSPDTLYKVFYHLYFNAFQPGSAMDVRSRTISDPDGRVKDRISKLTPSEIGYQHVLSLKQDNAALTYTVEGTVLEVKLSRPLLPGQKAVFDMEFEGQVPIQIRRSGRDSQDGVDYSMTQWYPKMCEYDYMGWHADPYIGREFYGVWGDFDVTIMMDKNYLIGGTGEIQNPQEVGHGYEDKTVPLKLPSGNKLKWHFIAKNVHDFAWAADRDYMHDVVGVPRGPVVHFIYQNDKSAENWKKLQPYMVKFFQLMEVNFGKYPYAHFSFIQGGDGGMEYPMMTLVTSRGSLNGLISVCVHEAIHNWYYGVLGTNESKYPWMDEGFTTYAQDMILPALMEYQTDNPQKGNYDDYIALIKSGNKEVLSTHADFYHKNRTYGSSAYSSGAVFLSQLSYVTGVSDFKTGMLRYFDEWKFRHPSPYDFIRVMEKASDLELDWYLEQFIQSMNEVDYGIASVQNSGGKAEVTLKRIGDFPMPLDIYVEYDDGTLEIYNIPLDVMRGNKKAEGTFTYKVLPDWQWVNPEYKFALSKSASNVKSVVIDASQRLCDIDPKNNIWPGQVENK